LVPPLLVLATTGILSMPGTFQPALRDADHLGPPHLPFCLSFLCPQLPRTTGSNCGRDACAGQGSSLACPPGTSTNKLPRCCMQHLASLAPSSQHLLKAAHLPPTTCCIWLAVLLPFPHLAPIPSYLPTYITQHFTSPCLPFLLPLPPCLHTAPGPVGHDTSGTTQCHTWPPLAAFHLLCVACPSCLLDRRQQHFLLLPTYSEAFSPRSWEGGRRKRETRNTTATLLRSQWEVPPPHTPTLTSHPHPHQPCTIYSGASHPHHSHHSLKNSIPGFC